MVSAEGIEKKGELILSSIVYPRRSSETNALLLAESIRAFAGSLSRSPIWCFTPELGEPLSKAFTERLRPLDVTLMPFEIDREVLRFPFTAEAHAASIAESKALGKGDILAWLNPNSVVLKEPKDFLLREDKILGYRPVHHTLVGSRFDEPLDPFWTLIYRYCGVPEDRVFPMKTHVDDTVIRPYFNSGILVARPEKGLLKAWRETYFNVYQEPSLQDFYRLDRRYRIFVHQAVLSGVILSTFSTDEIQELPPVYNYPLHLIEEDVTDHPPTGLEELVTIRHEGFYEDPEWVGKIPAREPLKQWIAERLLS
jgi:hypothetical protein